MTNSLNDLILKQTSATCLLVFSLTVYHKNLNIDLCRDCLNVKAQSVNLNVKAQSVTHQKSHKFRTNSAAYLSRNYSYF